MVFPNTGIQNRCRWLSTYHHIFLEVRLHGINIFGDSFSIAFCCVFSFDTNISVYWLARARIRNNLILLIEKNLDWHMCSRKVTKVGWLIYDVTLSYDYDTYGMGVHLLREVLLPCYSKYGLLLTSLVHSTPCNEDMQFWQMGPMLLTEIGWTSMEHV